jgi:hypothetical protein
MIAAEPDYPDATASAIDATMRRLCRALSRAVYASGVGLAVLTDDGSRGLTAASDVGTAELEDLQFTCGEGPCVEAFARRRPVLVPDLSDGMRRWPGYAPAARAQGVHAVFAFPLQVGAARLGTLDVFRDLTGALTATEVALAATFAEVAVSTLLDNHQQATRQGHADGLGPVFAPSAELFQAQGMVMVQIQGSITDAMATIRAYAFANNRPVADVAADVVARRISFTDNTTSPE